MAEPARIIRWEEPPRVGKGRDRGQAPSRYASVADALRERRGEWAVVTEDGGRGLATVIRLGVVSCFSPAGDFDAVVRRIDGKSVTYARYVGDSDE